jgi:hypothetical protein
VFVLLLSGAVAGCGADDNPEPSKPGDPGLVHIHGLGRNSTDGSLLIATHTGLFRASGKGSPPTRVAGNRQDTMGFTVVGPDHFLGSGHPADISQDPPFLGLIASRDAGKSWSPISLRGKVDFHVLETQGGVVYGFGSDFDSREARFLRSDDSGRSWRRLAPPEPLLGLAIDPANARRVVALGEERGYLSRDAGETWRPLDVPGGLVTWTRELGLVAISLDGTVWRTDDPLNAWSERGRIDGPPAALEGVDGELLAATHDARVLSSPDGGAHWQELIAGA